ncbi:hypothetical protein [Lysobacter gummosus]
MFPGPIPKSFEVSRSPFPIADEVRFKPRLAQEIRFLSRGAIVAQTGRTG